MQIQYNAIGERPFLPRRIKDGFGEIWDGSENQANRRVHELLNPDGQYGKVFTGEQKLLTWDMNGDAGSFSFLVPEIFHQNRIIIVPPQGINLNPHASRKGRVIEIQSALLAITRRNSIPGVQTCLSALIDMKKREALGPHLKQAGYYELGKKSGTIVYVHKETESVQNAVEKVLGQVQ
ncbi:MAG: hypothetical protein HHAS10_00100 [Candidatus Altimarinota bacterium]